jgi:hypothetical protein
MTSIFNAGTRAELLSRLATLEPGAPARWGRMNAPQMLAHCAEGLRMALGEVWIRRGLPSLIGWAFKKLAYDERPFHQGAPTARELRVADPRDFSIEKTRLLEALHKLEAGPQAVGNPVHPFFGRLDGEQWGVLLYKHLDHHFRQFGV